jgi:hypothetical protein
LGFLHLVANAEVTAEIEIGFSDRAVTEGSGDDGVTNQARKERGSFFVA